MSVQVIFHCNGCFAKAEGTDRLRVTFRSFSGRFGRVVATNTVADITPEGWIAYDPYTFCTYCPKCWAQVIGDEPLDDDEEVTT